MNKQIGKVNKKVIDILGLDYEEGKAIFIGENNIKHMKEKHYEDFVRYGNDIEEIISNPTYIARNPNQDSIEYIKEYIVDNELVLVAVRTSNQGTMFVKTLFTMSEKKKNIYLTRGYAKKY